MTDALIQSTIESPKHFLVIGSNQPFSPHDETSTQGPTAAEVPQLVTRLMQLATAWTDIRLRVLSSLGSATSIGTQKKELTNLWLGAF
eukprot:scaffold201361_cov49-Prasinocladus_malaysianus.AAC.3